MENLITGSWKANVQGLASWGQILSGAYAAVEFQEVWRLFRKWWSKLMEHQREPFGSLSDQYVASNLSYNHNKGGGGRSLSLGFDTYLATHEGRKIALCCLRWSVDITVHNLNFDCNTKLKGTKFALLNNILKKMPP